MVDTRHRHSRTTHPGDPADAERDPAIEALTELIQSERSLAMAEEPALLEQGDPGRVWLLWFAIGATDEICRCVQRRAECERNQVFRHVVRLIFGSGVAADAGHASSSQQRIDLFESAGAEAVRACLRGDRKLGYYLEALRVSRQITS